MQQTLATYPWIQLQVLGDLDAPQTSASIHCLKSKEIDSRQTNSISIV